MPDSVTVDHAGLTVTTNTASEADLRAELEAPPPDASSASSEAPTAETPADAAGPVRDDKGRFLKREAATAPEPSALPLETPPAEPVEKPRHDPVARMKQALAQKAEAERRAAALEEELSRLRQPVRPPSTLPPYQPAASVAGEPQFEQFANEADPYTTYMQAWARWDHARQIDERFARYQAEQAAKAQQQTFEQRIQEGAQRFPDWQDALTSADTLGLQVSEVMKAAITSSPKAPDIVHFLATHPEECIQLAEESIQTPVAAATVMRRLLESHLMTAPAAPANGTGTASRPLVSSAKPPVKPVGSSPVVGEAPPGDDATAAEHARYWNRKLKVPGSR